jgi:16S rRNA (cytosine1402-N4)-methyltransferase
MMSELHEPVLLNSVVDLFFPLPENSLVCDATLGAGGHTARFLKLSHSCRVVAIDADPRMLTVARERLGDDPRVEYLHGWFDEVLPVRSGFDRILIDLGISMVHLKRGERGFSLKSDGPLDMRLNPTGGSETAEALILRWSERELAETIARYGEERYARRIAAAIAVARGEGIGSTGRLAEIIRDAVPPAYRYGRIHPATRTFQALRIAVNDELGRLERVIPRAASSLRPGGRLAIISFHSLEDRIVKHRFRALAGSATDHGKNRYPTDRYSTDRVRQPMVKEEGAYRVVTKRPIVPDETEVATNPASRSAKLRVLERMVDE